MTVIPAEARVAVGSTSLPLSDRNTAWDASAARKSLNPEDYPKAHFWRDGPADQVTSYKFPFAKRTDSGLIAVWRGVTAGAARLSQAKAVDEAAVQRKMGVYYRKAADQYGDPSIRPPWEANSLRHTVTIPIDDAEWRDSGDPARSTETTLRGHAAVFGSLSDDLGGFRELLAPGAFRAVLRTDPDVRLLLNHDPNYVLGRTAARTLELREDATGLHVFARVDRNISWVEDLRTSMQRGDIDQMSFAFTINPDGDSWSVTDDGQAIRTIQPDGVNELFDVSVVTYPAYEHTNVDMRSVLDAAVAAGKLPESLAGGLREQHIEMEMFKNSSGVDSIAETGAGPESRKGSGVNRGLEQLKRRARIAVEQTPTKR